LVDIKNMLSDNDFRILGDNLFSEDDILRKSVLNFFNGKAVIQAVASDLIVKEDQRRQEIGEPELTIVDMLSIVASVTLSVSGSIDGRKLKSFEQICSQRVKVKDKKKSREDEK